MISPQLSGTDPASIERRLAELAEIAEDERRDRRIFLRTLALLIVWPTLGIAGMAWGFGMDDEVLGPTVFFGSAALADIGILWTLASAYLRSEG